jgi:hypothetical protein
MLLTSHTFAPLEFVAKTGRPMGSARTTAITLPSITATPARARVPGLRQENGPLDRLCI